MQTVDDVRPVLQDLRRRLESTYGDRLSDVVLFGSYARGEATEDSDIDVLVVLRGDVDRYDELDRLGSLTTDLLAEHGEFVTFTVTTTADFASDSTPFIRTVHEDGVSM
jgi:predicted nucleotidyltransferase